jgi:hypothetical protein
MQYFVGVSYPNSIKAFILSTLYAGSGYPLISLPAVSIDLN